ncbi:MAG: TlpA family protein disulfide reductase [Chloroflexi bacterium]|uniref:TlpA family protein disulfide reductase n=1 Tax=Candidatus Chlorohelix allophototropha TaxID=3003348 RepID=A0A8T7M2V1_9CHLR|nr:TlpA family protein disulfide reductase [Chloroflexota bacterium]WJW67479.1 TlpA family protein disulfide reductase [Chloroflexota bacterium L227-S17]
MANTVEKDKKEQATTTVRPRSSRPDSTGARLARFALGSIFGLAFLLGCYIMLATALRGPDTITMDGVTQKAGLIPNQKLPTEELKENDIAPDFALSQLGGNPVQLSKFRGKVVFVNFWASWCIPCQDEMKDINDFYKLHKNDSSVAVLTVNQKEDDSTIKSFFKDNGGVTVPVLLDKNSEVAGGYFVTKFPESYFLDKNGKIVAIKRGQLSAAEIKDFYQKALASGI